MTKTKGPTRRELFVSIQKKLLERMKGWAEREHDRWAKTCNCPDCIAWRTRKEIDRQYDK